MKFPVFKDVEGSSWSWIGYPC